MSRGSADAVVEEKGSRSISDHELEADFAAIACELKMLEQNTVTEDNPYLVHCDDFYSMPLTRGERDERANAKRAQSGGAAQPQLCSDDDSDIGSDGNLSDNEDGDEGIILSHPFAPEPLKNVVAGEPERRRAASKQSEALCIKYMDHLDREGKKGLSAGANQVHSTLKESAEISRDWYWATKNEMSGAGEGEDDCKALGEMFKCLRYIKFGSERITEGPDMRDIPQWVTSEPSNGHIDVLDDLIKQGHRPARLGPAEGYYGEAHDSAVSAKDQIFKSFLKTALKWQSINYPVDLKGELVGVCRCRFAPLGAVEKTDDHKKLVCDEDGDVEMRPVHDHTHADHPLAHNTGCKSYRVAKQLGTDDQTIAMMAIRERKLNPHHPLRANKLDYTGAYRTCGVHPDDIGEYAAEFDDILNVSGVLTFGPGDASGTFEVMGAAASCSIRAVGWDDPGADGEIPPRHVRCSDDTLHLIAARGNRQLRHNDNFCWLMKTWAGDDALNEAKAEAAGGYTNYQHGFGSLVDCERGGEITALSRVCRSEDKVVWYLQDKGARLAASDVDSMAGSLRHTFKKVLGLGDLVSSRLAAMQSDMARPEARSFGRLYEPSAAFAGETREEGEAAFRMCLGVAWRMVTIENGKHCRLTFEECLETGLRDTFPGNEAPSSKVFLESDASGTGVHAFDPITGKFIQEWWTLEELEAQFDFSRDDHGVIMSNEEFLGPEWGVPMMIEDHPDAKRICNRNDNQNVVDALNDGKTANLKNLEALLFIKAISFATGVGVEAEKCRSEDNKRSDPGSRKEDQSDWIAEKAIWESRAGKESVRQQVDPTLRSLATWTAAPTKKNAIDRLECV